MTVELTPLGVACNLSCTYCYQHPMRDAGNMGNKKPYDLEKMFAALTEENAKFSVFGGEPLLVPLDDLERIWEFGFVRWKENGIQTNGVLITPAHIGAFMKWNVHVGFSLDGPDELNDSRWAGTLERTRESTEKSHANLRACIAAGVRTSVIVTLYRGNASAEKLPRLKEWIRELDRIDTKGIRIHTLEVDHPVVREKMQLKQEEVIVAIGELIKLERELSKLRLDVTSDVRRLLRVDDDQVTCTWNPCDPYTTSAVHGVDGQGNRTNCGRTNKDGIPRLKGPRVGFERQLALYRTPQADGGCQGCRFFIMCKGQCPGTAIDGDWRNRSQDCPTWMFLFETLEREMLENGELPLSLSPDRLRLESAMLGLWETGQTMSLKSALARINAGQTLVSAFIAGNVDHGDAPHGDEHGDHWDDAPSELPHGDAPHGDHTDAEAGT